MSDWQPIETAPKDGAPILAASYEADCDGVFCWCMTTVKWRVWGGYWALCEAVAYAESLGWRWFKLTGHGWGELLCPLCDRECARRESDEGA